MARTTAQKGIAIAGGLVLIGGLVLAGIRHAEESERIEKLRAENIARRAKEAKPKRKSDPMFCGTTRNLALEHISEWDKSCSANKSKTCQDYGATSFLKLDACVSCVDASIDLYKGENLTIHKVVKECLK